MPGLREVARRAGVSVATASRVASGSGPVHPATRARVEQAMQELLYIPHQHEPATRSIGVIVPELANPVFPLLCQAIERRAARARLTCILCNTAWGALREAEYVRMLLQRRVDGIIFVSSEMTDRATDRPIFERLVEKRVPFVLVNGSTGAPSTTVTIDERAGAQMATEHLISLGHRRIGFISRPEELSVQPKHQGWEAAMQASGLPVDDLVVQAEFSVEGGRKGILELLHRNGRSATAVVCGSDIVAIGAMRGAAESGLDVPSDLSVIGFDGIDAGAWTRPALTTIEQPIEEIADTAVSALETLVQDPERELPDFVFRPRLRVRGSSSPPPGVG